MISMKDLDLLTIGLVMDIWTEKGNDGVEYDPSWGHIPNYCKECKRKYQDEHCIPKIVKRKCKRCGKQFTFPSTIKHYSNYCKDCRAKFKEKNGLPIEIHE